ncbi:histidine phosphatase family protein [Nonomuraea glycinis]|uniref:Alpha-ribazole phosphatase n=1 Tax=Nonomuraea glycinis TaxID=2047744 RepID=A0A918E2U2_9ACTN|nr:histidine phosphatase family protein [Nonomuraea glycinis]MCA2175037.1 histidine phosphatase family protein [Nonomuraea glycinis]GGP01032.1 alpha-ribazole phosphatase [Nonomuraea glycinis]
MTNLVLVRHGETVWHAENRYAGISDIELTPAGHEQAARLAAWAATAGLSGVWASTLSRSRITAAAGADAARVKLAVDVRLREVDFGKGEGLTAAEMRELFPEARAAFEADPGANPLPGGEDPALAADRFVAALRDIAATVSSTGSSAVSSTASSTGPGERVLVVAHTTVIRLALCRLIGVPLGEYRRLFPRLDNCAITELRLRGDRAAILQYNSPIGAVR